MSTFEDAVNREIQRFVSRIAALAARAALDTVNVAFGRRKGRPPGTGRGKRTSIDLDALADRFTAFVKANPGLRIEQINKQIGTTTSELALPIRKLLATGKITTKGQKRSTTYFAGKKSKG